MLRFTGRLRLMVSSTHLLLVKLPCNDSACPKPVIPNSRLESNQVHPIGFVLIDIHFADTSQMFLVWHGEPECYKMHWGDEQLAIAAKANPDDFTPP